MTIPSRQTIRWAFEATMFVPEELFWDGAAYIQANGKSIHERIVMDTNQMFDTWLKAIDWVLQRPDLFAFTPGELKSPIRTSTNQVRRKHTQP